MTDLYSWSIFEKFPEIRALYTGKSNEAGLSHAPWNRFNLALHVGDNPEHVIENRGLLCQRINTPLTNFTCGEQIHGNHVERVTLSSRGRGALSRESEIKKTDALITSEKGILLAIFLADCLPLVFYDPVNKVGGVCHAGWRGMASLIPVKTVETLAREFGSQPGDLRIGLGPCIDHCCFSIGEDTEKTLQDSFSYPERIYRKELKEGITTRFFNLKEAARYQLESQGVPREHIETSPYCTSCRSDLFFSYRKSGGETGRFSTLFQIRD